MPLLGHDCSAFATRFSHALMFPLLLSRRIAASHTSGTPGIFSLACSSIALALDTFPSLSSNPAAHRRSSGTSGQCLIPRSNARRAPATSPLSAPFPFISPPSTSLFDWCSCASISQSFQACGCFLSASCRSLLSSSGFPSSLSTSAAFIQTRGLAPPAPSCWPWPSISPPFSPLLLYVSALLSRSFALSISLFSNSSLNAASTTCSLFGLAAKASCRIVLAFCTSSLLIHASLAAMSHKVVAVGQYVTPFLRMASERSGIPFCCSSTAALIQSLH
mmetsp:Transcript_3143/g.5280  ORF Transcript_3143/g.5280 Transcript_3143/m.5280 type:complete len:276 (+) Transcript_3143:487-1314(+)